LSEGITLVILVPMKTAVSIPDPIFHTAESLAKRLGISRSELFSRALEAYLEAHKHDSVREALDAIYSQESSRLDETLAHMQWASLPKEDW
jgi:metal-responsive CopG/Arc/MetJ family transcriptional regulator